MRKGFILGLLKEYLQSFQNDCIFVVERRRICSKSYESKYDCNSECLKWWLKTASRKIQEMYINTDENYIKIETKDWDYYVRPK